MRFFLIAIWASVALAQSTANLWIDSNGGTCTRSASPAAYVGAAACSSFTAAYNAALGGDTIYVKSATYGDQVVPTRSLGVSYVTISSTPGETVNTGAISVQSNYVIINGFQVGNHTLDVAPAGSGSTCTEHNVIISNNVLAGTAARINAGCDNITIKGNDISGTNQCVSGSEDAIQLIGFGDFGNYIPSNMTVQNNYIHDMATAEDSAERTPMGSKRLGAVTV